MHTRSKDPHGAGFREVSIVEDYVIEQAPTTEDAILALFTAKNPQWPVFLISQKTGIATQTVDSAVRRLLKAGRLTVQNGVIRLDDGRRRPVKLYSLA